MGEHRNIEIAGILGLDSAGTYSLPKVQGCPLVVEYSTHKASFFTAGLAYCAFPQMGLTQYFVSTFGF